MARLYRDVHVIGTVVAVDGMVADQGLSQIQRLDRKIKQTTSVVAAHFALELLLACRQAKNRLAAAAARGAVTDGASFEQRDLVAALRQMQCRGAAGDTAAEHRDVGTDFPAQGLARRPGVVEGVVGGGGRTGAGAWAICGAKVFKILWLLTGIGACEPT